MTYRTNELESSLANHCIKRTSIGLKIDVSKLLEKIRFKDDGLIYSDDFFSIEKGQYDFLIEWQKSRIRNNKSNVIFVPLANPQTIRLSKRKERINCFNLGELYRFRVLKYLPSYPFKPHQKTGVQWLQDRTSGILADDMGLGKTLQSIAALDNLLRKGSIKNALIVCPKSLLGVWESELELWAPHLCKVTVTNAIESEQWRAVSKQTHIAITNYETVRNTRPDARVFDLALFDEIHKLKNHRSLNFTSLINLKPRVVWGLSGTPLENTASELVTILHLLDQNHISLSDAKLGVVSIRRLASKYILRRDKQTLKDELPDIFEKIEYVPLTHNQKLAYNKLLARGSKARLKEWIATFTQLRKICDYDPISCDSSKVDRVLEIIKAILNIHEKVVVFSYLVSPLEILERRLRAIFKESASSSSMLAKLDGSSTSEERSATIKLFQDCEQPQILLCTTRALAEGVTLTKANHVIFLNEWWNPSINAQARDRVHRIGQKKDVYVYKLRTVRTIESRLEEILEQKSLLFAEIVSRLSDSDKMRDTKTPRQYLEILGPYQDRPKHQQ